MKKNLLVLTFVLLTVFAFGQKLPFQGKLIESGTVVDGTRTFAFEISSVGWSETHNDVPVTDGLYFIVLGTINPLPDSLFYGVTEQNMNITVSGNPLSPVILFKPLSSPFEGSELVVKNDEGTVVGSMHAKTDSISKNGELILSGTSGNPNVSLGASGATGDQGAIQIHDSVGTVKAELWSADVNGRFRLYGENTGKLNMGFSKPWDPNGGETLRDLPSVSLEVDGLYYSNTYVVQNDTAIRGRFYLSSNVGEFNMIRTDGHFMYKDNVLMSQYRIQDWGGTGYSGYFDLRGPSSRNIEMGSKQWVNADLPWFKLMGSQNQDVLQMSASEDSTESAYINLLSQDEKEASFYTTGLRFNTTGDNGREMISLNNQDPSGNGYAGYLDLSGPGSGNIHLGTRHWENPDIPLLNLYGSEGQNILELSAETDSIESGKIIINSKNGSSTYLSTNGLNVFNSPNNKSVDVGSTHFALRDDANGYHHLVDLSTHNGSGNGWAGYFSLRGPNSDNINMGTRDWEGTPDLPLINLHGENDFHAMELSVTRDGNGDQFGWINLNSENGRSLHLSPEGFGAQGVGMETHTKDSLKYGYLFTRGPNTTNFETGGHWHNPDRGYLNMNGDTDENRISISVGEDHRGEEVGEIFTNSADKKVGKIAPIEISLINNENDLWNNLASMSTQNDNDNGWYGSFSLRGPSSQNIHIGSREWINSNLPKLNLYGSNEGTNDFHAMELSVEPDGEGNEFGFINLHSQNGNSLHLSPDGVGFEKVNIYTGDDGNGNKSGEIGISGGNTLNIAMGGKHWEDIDLPFFHMFGKNDGTNDFHAIDMSVDGSNGEVAYLDLRAKNGMHNWLSATEVVLHNTSGQQSAVVQTLDNGQGEYGHFHLNGPSTTNVESGTHDNPDRPHINMNGETDANRLTFIVENDDRGVEVGRSYTYSADEKLTRIEPTNITLFDAPGGNWNGLASIGMNNDNGSWVGTVDVNGPISNNVHIGSQQNPNLPWITLQGTDGHEAMQIGAVDDITERGFIKMVNKDSGEEMFYSSHGVGGNNSFQIDGGSIINGTLELNGDFTGTGTSTYSSDKRFKKNIKSIGNNTLQKVKLLEGVSYIWRQDEFPDKNFSSEKQIGVIAQELEAQFPELVKTDKAGYKSVNYNGFTAVLLEAVKELNAKVEKLETENIQLKAELLASASNTSEIEQLKEQMQTLVKMVQLQYSEDINEDFTSTPGLK